MKRFRRLRKTAGLRNLVEETFLTKTNLTYPVFFVESPSVPAEEIRALPGHYRWELEKGLKHIEEAMEAGVRNFALFPVVDPQKKDPQGSESSNPDQFACRCLKRFKKEFPDSVWFADVALDPFTSHGHDGLIDENGHVLNDPTVQALSRQALCLAQAGADVIAPSDMMDGRVAAIRKKLDDHALVDTAILSYAAKYASAFYGPFREAVGSSKALGKADKKSYQMNPANRIEAISEGLTDEAEGADLLMVKPAGFYLDIIRDLKDSTTLPIFAFQVSGEYSMLHALAEKGLVDMETAMLESLISIKRAGASGIFSYFAMDICKSNFVR